MKKVLVFGDCHLDATKTCDYSYALMKKYAKTKKWDEIICLGDWLDFTFIGHFADVMAAEGRRINEDLQLLRSELRFFKSILKKGGKLIYLEGNHEERLQRLIRSQPVLEGLVSIKSVCEELGVEYVLTEEQPYKYNQYLYIAHGLCWNKNYTDKLAREVGNNIIVGHCHRNQTTTTSYPDGRTVTAWGLGSLTEQIEEYVKGKALVGHSNGFAVVYVDEDDYFGVNPILIHDGVMIIDGVRYEFVEEG